MTRCAVLHVMSVTTSLGDKLHGAILIASVR